MPVKIRGSFGTLVRSGNFASQYQAAVSAGDITEPESYSTTDLNSDLNVTGSAPKYVCRAYVRFNGKSTLSVTLSRNVSSVVDNGTGDYSVNLTTGMATGNYAWIARQYEQQGRDAVRVSHTSTQLRFRNQVTTTASYNDNNYYMVHFFV